MAEMLTIPEAVLRRQIGAVFDKWGMSPQHRDTTVDVMVETDLRGIDSHGLGMLPMYQGWHATGYTNPRPDIRVVRDLGAIALIEADRSLGHAPGVMAMGLAVDKARALGAGIVAVTNSSHYGAAGYYSLLAAGKGMLGMSLTSAPSPVVVPTFGREPIYGTNPIAFAAPASKSKPFSLDMATSTVAFGKVNVARRAGKPMPLGWALNKQGQPESDAAVAFKARRITPLGGSRELGSHKGYGLAMMVEILCSTLTGSSWPMGESGSIAESAEGRKAARRKIGHFFLAIDPAKFRDGGGFGDDLDDLMRRLRATPPVDPAQAVLVPGDPEYAEYERRKKDGIPVTATLAEEVREVCKDSGAEFMLK